MNQNWDPKDEIETPICEAPADGGLEGSAVAPPAGIVCAVCGYLNEVRHFDPAFPPSCQNPAGTAHLLKFD